MQEKTGPQPVPAFPRCQLQNALALGRPAGGAQHAVTPCKSAAACMCMPEQSWLPLPPLLQVVYFTVEDNFFLYDSGSGSRTAWPALRLMPGRSPRVGCA